MAAVEMLGLMCKCGLNLNLKYTMYKSCWLNIYNICTDYLEDTTLLVSLSPRVMRRLR